MTNKRYTDEEIIKALVCCLCDNSECLQCQDKELCKIERNELAVKALDLINRKIEEIDRLKAEIERLKSANDEKFRQWDMLAEKTKQHYADLYNEAKDTLKAEAYKEYHIKAKSCLKANRDVEQQIGNNYVVKRIKEIENRFDNILKEMVLEEERI